MLRNKIIIAAMAMPFLVACSKSLVKKSQVQRTLLLPTQLTKTAAH